MTPPQKKTPSGTKSAKQATKSAKSATRKTAKATKKSAAKKATKPSKAAPKAAPKKAPSTKDAVGSDEGAVRLGQCAALTTKGTRCRLKPSDDTLFCARHQDASAVAPEVAPALQGQKNGTASPAQAVAEEPPSKPAAAKPKGRAKPKAPPALADFDEAPAEAPQEETAARPKGRAKPIARRPKTDDAPSRAPGKAEDAPQVGSEDDEAAADGDEDFVLYSSEYSTTLEASPYDDQVSKAIAEGEDDVDLVDEHQMGRGSRGPPRHQRPQQRQQEQRPRMTQEEAEAKALEKLGPRPEIAPEEDLDEVLVTYDRKFKSEVNHLLGRKRRKRGRRGGRRRGPEGDGRGGGGGGGGQGGGGRRGGGGGGGGGRRGGRKRRGRGGGGGGGQSGGDGGSGGGGGGRSDSGRRGPPKNVARDSPLANNRPSRGPKRAVQPRRRRQPDV